MPKTLIFAKTDAHADDIVQAVGEVFGEGNEFCQKITYRADDPEQVLRDFRTRVSLRVAVTLDMIATGRTCARCLGTVLVADMGGSDLLLHG